MSWVFVLFICGADVPQGECAAPAADLVRQELEPDKAACIARATEFVKFWIRPDREGIPGQHFFLDCKELPGA
jgi:hypothetical protein